MFDANKSIQNHRTVRNFVEKDIPEDMLDNILLSAQSMPTAYNHQDVAVIVVKDKARKDLLAELSWNQEFIKKAPVFLIFVADLYKSYLACKKNKVEMDLKNPLDKILTATLDAGLIIGGAIIAAESMGLGTTPIGGIKHNISRISKILDLPEYVFPVLGLCIGFPYNIPDKTPRFSRPAFVHEETYKKDAMISYINEYDEIMHNHLIKIKKEQYVNWSYKISNLMSKESDTSLVDLLKNQKIIEEDNIKQLKSD